MRYPEIFIKKGGTQMVLLRHLLVFRNIENHIGQHLVKRTDTFHAIGLSDGAWSELL